MISIVPRCRYDRRCKGCGSSRVHSRPRPDDTIKDIYIGVSFKDKTKFIRFALCEKCRKELKENL